MKKYIKYLSVVAAAISMSSCSDFLDTTPSTALTTREAIQSYEDAFSTLIGVYDAVQGNSSSLGWYGARAVYYGDVRGDLMQTETDGSRTVNLYDMDYDANTKNPDMWTVPYDAVRRASNLIEAIETPGQITDAEEYAAELADIKAQCIVIRALAHFDLCKVYAPLYTADPTALAVPIVDFAPEPTYKPARNTVSEVYTFVVSEIEGCINDLYKSSVAGESYGFVDYWTAQALLSRIYLFKGDYQKSLAAAEDVINNGPYYLMSNADYSYIWGATGEGCPEHIWEIVSNGSDDWVDREGVPYLLWESGYADYILSSKAVAYFAAHPNDVRGTVTIPAMRSDKPYMTRYGTDPVFCAKYPGNGADVRSNNIYGIRIAEVYLNAAEAAVHAAPAKVKGFYDAIASRDADYNPKATSTVTLDMVIEQRGIELLGEGHRYFDLARNGKEINRTDRYTHIFPDPKAEVYTRDWFKSILPIPLGEMNANENMKQNPGYGQ